MLELDNIFSHLQQLFSAHVEIIIAFCTFKTVVAHPLGFCAEVSLPDL